MRTQPAPNGGYQVVGYLRDGFDQGLPSRQVKLDGPSARPCEAGSDTTGPEGEFCFRVQGKAGSEITLSVEDSAFHVGTSAAVPLDPDQAQLGLRLFVEADEFDLRRPTHPLRVGLETQQADRAVYRVEVQIREESKRPGEPAPVRWTGTQPVSARKNANFAIPSSKLGAPGSVVIFATISVADQLLAVAQHQVVLVDTAELAWREALEPVRPSFGFDLLLSANATSGPVQSGWVEASIGETPVGVAQVANGEATVSVRFQAPRLDVLPLTIRYLPEHPWYRAGPVLTADLRVLPTPWWGYAPWFVVALVATYWIVRTWRRPRRRKASKTEPPASRGQAEVVVLDAKPNARAWTGRVVDAHTGLSIAASLRIQVPSISGETTLVAKETSPDGTFHIDRQPALPEGARFVASAPAYTELRQRVPPLGELRISLVTRRRTLLHALIGWATEMGRPWSPSQSATPSHVAEVARHRDDEETRRWANDIELAVYGPLPPDGMAEQSLLSRTPPLDRPKPHKR